MSDIYDKEAATIRDNCGMDGVHVSPRVIAAILRSAVNLAVTEVREGAAAVEHVAVMEGKPSDYTDAEVERMARAGNVGLGLPSDRHLATRKWSVGRVLDGAEGIYVAAFTDAVLAEKAKIDAEKMPPASEPADSREAFKLKWSGPAEAQNAGRCYLCRMPFDAGANIIGGVLTEFGRAGSQSRWVGRCVECPASEPAPREAPRCTCRHAPNHVGPLTEAHGCPCGPSCPCIASETPAAPTGTWSERRAELAAALTAQYTAGRAPDAAPTGTARDLTFRALRFNSTTGAVSWNNKSAALHPDRCACQDEVTPHKHYDEPPHACARCGCTGYVPWEESVAAPPPPPAMTSCDQCSTRHALYGPCPPPPAEPRAGEALRAAMKSTDEAIELVTNDGEWPSPQYEDGPQARRAGAMQESVKLLGGAVREILNALDLPSTARPTVTPAPAPQPVSGEVAEIYAALDHVIRGGGFDAINARVMRAHVERLAREVGDAGREDHALRCRIADLEKLLSTARLSTDTLRARVAELTAELAREKAAWQRVYDLDVGRLNQRVAELEGKLAAAVNAVPTSTAKE